MQKKISIRLTIEELEMLIDWGNDVRELSYIDKWDKELLDKLTEKMKLERCAEKAREIQRKEEA